MVSPPLPVATAPKQEQPANPPKKKNDTKSVASTHTGRMTIISAFIKEQLEANDGKMSMAALLPALNGLPEYRVDQQRSKRNAHNYLMRLYGDTFSFEEGESGSFISLRKNVPEAAVESTEAEEAPADALPEIEASEQEPAASAEEDQPQEAPAEESPAPEEPEAQPDEQAQAIAAFAARLVDAGIPDDAAQQIIAILNENSNLRTVYNKMRVAFGGDTGRKYYQIVKEVGRG